MDPDSFTTDRVTQCGIRAETFRHSLSNSLQPVRRSQSENLTSHGRGCSQLYLLQNAFTRTWGASGPAWITPTGRIGPSGDSTTRYHESGRLLTPEGMRAILYCYGGALLSPRPSRRSHRLRKTERLRRRRICKERLLLPKRPSRTRTGIHNFVHILQLRHRRLCHRRFFCWQHLRSVLQREGIRSTQDSSLSSGNGDSRKCRSTSQDDGSGTRWANLCIRLRQLRTKLLYQAVSRNNHRHRRRRAGGTGVHYFRDQDADEMLSRVTPAKGPRIRSAASSAFLCAANMADKSFLRPVHSSSSARV